jgi:hypothetical protein
LAYSPHSLNRLLASLAPADIAAILPCLKTIELLHRTVLYKVGDTISRVYFPQSGVISLVVDLASGETIETGMIGRESAVGGLMISYLSEHEDAEETKRLVEEAGRKAIVLPGDIQHAAHCRAIVDKSVSELGGLDILVNNAAHQATFKDIEDITEEEWELTFKVNIHAMFHLTKAAVPHMKPGSAIINTASINSDSPIPRYSPMLRQRAPFRISRPAWPSSWRRREFARMRSHRDRSGRRSSLRPCPTTRSSISANRFP